MNNEEFNEVCTAMKLVLDAAGSTYASQDTELADMISGHSNYEQFADIFNEAEEML